MNLARQLDALVLSLRRPSVSHEDRVEKLKRVAYYLPQVRNPQNLWLVLNELALSPDLLTSIPVEDLSTVLFAVDAVTYAANRKMQISDPTIVYSEWERIAVETAYRVPPVFGLVILSGLCAHGSQLESQLLPFVLQIVPKMTLCAAACLARAQWAPKVKMVFAQMPRQCRSELLASLIPLIYSSQTVRLEDPLIAKDFGSWSRTLSYLFEHALEAELLKFLDIVHIFVRTAVSVATVNVKPLAFGVAVQLQGVMSQVVTNARMQSRGDVVLGVLRVLQPLNFMYEEVGTFENHEFVFNACLDALQSALTRQQRLQVVRILGDNWAYGQAVTTEVNAGELLFFFEVCEPLMPLFDTSEAEHLVIPIARRFLGGPFPVGGGPAVFEAAHSVVLAYLATHPSYKFTKSGAALDYFEQLAVLFPAYVTGRQLATAVSVILKAVRRDKVDLVLNRLFVLAKSSLPGMPISGDPPTLRAALVSTLLHSVAQYASAQDMAVWLHRIGSMVPPAYSDATAVERKFLIQDFKDVVTSLGDYSDIGIRWFFGEGWSRL